LRVYWLFLSFLSVLLLSSPVQAARLLFWRFEPTQNRLEFSTDTRVQPKAQLISNPTRLIIDLPGVTLGRPTINQAVGGAVRSVRIGQFDSRTTRIVVELAPGYTLDPQQVKVRGMTATQWSVELPTPHRIGQQPNPPSSPTTRPVISSRYVRATTNGLYLDIGDDGPEEIEIERSRDRKTLDINLEGATLRPDLAGQIVTVNQYGVGQIQFTQVSNELARLTLTLSEDSPDWRALSSSLGGRFRGLVLLPRGGIAAVPGGRNAAPPPSNPPGGIPVPPPDRTTPPVPTPPVAGRILVTIDPGHGGKDPGAIGLRGLREKDVILPISLEVARILESQGVRVQMTRADDRFISLAGRTQIANRARANLFISIHANAVGGGRSSVNGVETFYFSTGRGLATAIQNSIIQSLGPRNRGVKRARFYVLRNTSMPSALVEVGFVTGREDSPRLADPAYRSQMAAAIARGILQYIGQNRF